MPSASLAKPALMGAKRARVWRIPYDQFCSCCRNIAVQSDCRILASDRQIGWAGACICYGSIVRLHVGILTCGTKTTFPTLVIATCHRTAGELQPKPEQLEVMEAFVYEDEMFLMY